MSESNRFTLGSLSFWATGDRLLIQEDEFRSGYECQTCGGPGKVDCSNCDGAGHNGPKKCSHCNGDGKVICSACEGKGGLLIAPETSQRRPTSGKIVSAGPECKYLKVGDSVLYSNFAGYTIDLDRAGAKVVLRILHETEILAAMSGQLTLAEMRSKSDIAMHSP